MSRTNEPTAPTFKSAQKGKSGADPAKDAKGGPSRDSLREVVESIALALILAFLFRGFEAEAFVIPTGSMAPTLMGRHKDLKCEKCDFPFTVSASDEVDQATNRIKGHIEGVVCPNCRYRMDLKSTVDLNKRQVNDDYPSSYTGDRIIVAKFPYELANPSRWDVAVFKYPEEAENNYIKRLAGLPNETAIIFHGDLYTAPVDRQPASPNDMLSMRRNRQAVIARKPPHKVAAMLQTVYDNDYVLAEAIAAGWPARWSPADAGAGAWRAADDYKSFDVAGDAKKAVWLRYRHFPAPAGRKGDNDREFWLGVEQGKLPAAIVDDAAPELVTDFYGYNTNSMGNTREGDLPSENWVGDLALSCEVHAQSSEGSVLFELREAGRTFQCEIDLQNGAARLTDSANEKFAPRGETPLAGPGRHAVRFANVDDQLCLWVDGDLVEFDAPVTYDSLDDDLPDDSDLTPASIGSRGAALSVDRLLLSRDIYYIAERERGGGGGIIQETDGMRHNLRRPLQSRATFEGRRVVSFTLGEDQFLALGDNSPRSKDSRLWPRGDQLVHRDLLIGKAVFVYWPHGLEKIPGTGIPFPFSLFPHFKRMAPVH